MLHRMGLVKLLSQRGLRLSFEYSLMAVCLVGGTITIKWLEIDCRFFGA